MKDELRACPFWLIKYDDDEMSDEVFTDEESAKKTYEMRLSNWTCRLFKTIDTRPIEAAKDAEIERLRGQIEEANQALYEAIVLATAHNEHISLIDRLKRAKQALQTQGDTDK